MKDYTLIRPGIAVTISAVTLTLSLVIGLWLIFSLSEAAETVSRGARTSEALHRYNAGLEVWRQMATGTDPGFRRIEAVARHGLRGHVEEVVPVGVRLEDFECIGHRWPLSLAAPVARRRVPLAYTSVSTGAGTDARQSMMVLLAKQDSAMFRAAQRSQQAVLLSAVLLALTIIAAGTLIVPMAWLYVRYKRGATIEVKV